jgi:AGZA family xanthine/uracil permease-like MFS transporter
MSWLDDRFELTARGSTVGREIRGGVSTFLAMAYILFVQPAMLSAAGMDSGAVLAATCIASALATFVMGAWANYPVALAPGMGLNAFFAFTVCGALRIPWQEGLGLVFLSGCLFLLLGLFGLRERIVGWVPDGLKHAIAAGIGLFLVFLGLKDAGLIVPDANTLVAVGDLSARWRPVTAAGIGLLAAAALAVRDRPSAVLAGIGAAFVAALTLGLTSVQGVFAAPPSLAPTAFQLSLAHLFTAERLGLVLLFLYTDLFDTVGTLVGVSARAGLLRDGRLPRAGRAFFADAVGTVAGALLGTSTVTAYIESTAGVQSGARTGLASVVTAALFLAALVLHPLVEAVGAGVPIDHVIVTVAGVPDVNLHRLVLHPVTAPALLLVGAMMAGSLRSIAWDDPLEGLPALAIVAGIPLTFSIADGISFGLIAASVLSLLAGQARRLAGPLHVIAAFLVLRWVAVLAGWV